jgi:DNA (cytosine-5)-methyltransferase 1
MGQFLDAPSALDDAESATPEQVAADSKFLNRKAAEGCGFRMRILTPDSEKCPTVCKTYGKRQPSATFIKTSSSYRMIRPRELARISGFPESFPLPEARTTAYEVLGQGVVFNPFFELGKALGGYLSGTAAASPKRAVVEQLELAM